MFLRVLLLVVVIVIFSQSLICSSTSEVTSEGAAVEKAKEVETSKEEIVLTNSIEEIKTGTKNGFKKRGIGSNIKFGNKRVDRKEESTDSTKENMSDSSSGSTGAAGVGKPRGLWDHLLGEKGEEAMKAINESKFERQVDIHINIYIFMYKL